MSENSATLTCSMEEPGIEINNGTELEAWLDKLTDRCTHESPRTVRLCVHGYEVEIGLGSEESFVHIDHESGMPPHFTTLGDAQAEGEVVFYVLGDRQGRTPRHNLIPIALARRVVREFFDTGQRSLSVEWEKET
jgi:hypothetical protein